jgi:hypothetical protein
MVKVKVLSVSSAYILILATLASCTINRRVIVSLSGDIHTRYDIYPSIELDVAAVTSDEADQIKNEGVDGYFSPDNPLRNRLDPFTAYFDEESTAPRELRRMDDLWRRWQRKNPSQLVVIVNLPHSANMPKDDPRLLFLGIKKTFFTPAHVYIQVEPDKVVRIYQRPKDPQAASSPAAKTDT